jgi:Xaa-Pro dipeptidase
MKHQQVQAVYLHAGTNLFYFTGMKWNSSERMVGAILFQNGIVDFISPNILKTFTTK